jgi:hypothetical protein
MLDNSNCRFLIVSYSENESYVFFKGIKVGKESVGITIYRSIFEELIEVRFDLVLGAST